MTSLDLEALQGFDLLALQNELERRRREVESLQWAIAEHKEQIQQLEFALAWKKQQEKKTGGSKK